MLTNQPTNQNQQPKIIIEGDNLDDELTNQYLTEQVHLMVELHGDVVPHAQHLRYSASNRNDIGFQP